MSHAKRIHSECERDYFMSIDMSHRQSAHSTGKDSHFEFCHQNETVWLDSLYFLWKKIDNSEIERTSCQRNNSDITVVINFTSIYYIGSESVRLTLTLRLPIHIQLNVFECGIFGLRKTKLTYLTSVWLNNNPSPVYGFIYKIIACFSIGIWSVCEYAVPW